MIGATITISSQHEKVVEFFGATVIKCHEYHAQANEYTAPVRFRGELHIVWIFKIKDKIPVLEYLEGNCDAYFIDSVPGREVLC